MSIKWENVVGYGLHTDRPAAGAPGALYFESDTGNGYRDNGTSWDLIVAASVPFAYTPVPVSADTTVSIGNVLVLVSGVHTITLPDAAATAGQTVLIKSTSGDSFSVLNPDTTAADGAGQVPWHGVSDGTQYWNVDF